MEGNERKTFICLAKAIDLLFIYMSLEIYFSFLLGFSTNVKRDSISLAMMSVCHRLNKMY